MKKLTSFFISHFLFWGIVFLFFRILFLATITPLPDGVGIGELLRVFYSGYRLDWSIVSYFAIVPFALTLIMVFGGERYIFPITKIYYALLILFTVILLVSNIIVFKYWGTLINNRAVAFVAQPKEMLASANNWELVLIFIFIGIVTVVCTRIFNKRVFSSFKEIAGTRLQLLIALIPWFLFIGIGIRGGIQLIPVNESSAVFSTHRVLNQAAINSIWYLGHNLKQSGLNEENPYQWMDTAQAEKRTSELLAPGRSCISSDSIFSDYGKPNIVIILLESWTADIIEQLDGIPGVTPEFSKLVPEGLLFTRIYSSGFRTDQALTSVLSGLPAQPNRSIIRFPDKTSKLPSLGRVLKGEGYTNSFYYGGETGFANMNSYLAESGFGKIVDISAFADDQKNSKWGVHDGFVLERHAKDLAFEKQPFFSVLLTLSTHEPFEVPLQTPFNGNDEPSLFKKAAWYTDACLGEYFRSVKKQSWYEHTIFILVADHGHRLPKNRDYFDPGVRRIPLLVLSPLLKSEYRGKKLNQVGNQHDIAATLLSALNLPSGEFGWSNNLLCSNRNNFAYLSLDNAITWVEDTSAFVVPLEPGFPGYDKNPVRQITAKAYLQHLYEQFTGF